MHGVTNRVFRNVFFAHFPGFDSAVAPFVLSVRGTPMKANHLKDLLAEQYCGIALVPQLLGNEADGFVDTAKALSEFGYREVNWNLGCPYPMVANKKRGSGLLPYPELIERFLEGVCSRLEVPLSIKVRLGRYDARELLALAPILNAFPLKKVIIHPRVGVQMYGGEVDLDSFAAAAAALRHEVVYNGDLKDPSAFAVLSARFPSVKEWMIGRWALSDPFLAARIKGLEIPADPFPALSAFHEDLYRAYRGHLFGPKHVLDKMKEIWSYLSLSFPDPEKTHRRISRSASLEAYEAAVAAAFSAGSSSAAGP